MAAALAAEQAAIFAYGILGVRLTGSLASEARAAEKVHRDRRDQIVLRLAGRNATAPPAPAGYALPFPVTDRASALRLAVEVEDRTAAVWRSALPATSGDERRQALDGLTESAVRAVKWRRAADSAPLTLPYPGRPA
ncbi:ferritin-like domain-containing protein [Plantactinospora sp. GCM10030261]|uniref:ferritin-like domain-containing protein n=1 Tax=Plantactinospora sp. GCM10030261 TaxID=3273420 RepID=UPI003613C2E3